MDDKLVDGTAIWAVALCPVLECRAWCEDTSLTGFAPDEVTTDTCACATTGGRAGEGDGADAASSVIFFKNVACVGVADADEDDDDEVSLVELARLEVLHRDDHEVPGSLASSADARL